MKREQCEDAADRIGRLERELAECRRERGRLRAAPAAIDREALGRIAFDAANRRNRELYGDAPAVYRWETLSESDREGYRRLAEAVVSAAGEDGDHE